MPRRARKDLAQTPIGDAVAELAQTLGINLLRVRTVKRNANVMRQRARLVQALDERGYIQSDVADILHCNVSTVGSDLRISLANQPARKQP